MILELLLCMLGKHFTHNPIYTCHEHIDVHAAKILKPKKRLAFVLCVPKLENKLIVLFTQNGDRTYGKDHVWCAVPRMQGRNTKIVMMTENGFCTQNMQLSYWTMIPFWSVVFISRTHDKYKRISLLLHEVDFVCWGEAVKVKPGMPWPGWREFFDCQSLWRFWLWFKANHT